MEYYAVGLDVPADIAQAAATVQRDADRMGQWIDTCCIEEAGAAAPVTELYTSYAWHLREVLRLPPEEILSLKAFSADLVRRPGLARVRARRPDRPNPATVVRGLQLCVGDGGVAVGGNIAPCAVSAGGAGAGLGM